jgi:hypothetical protein
VLEANPLRATVMGGSAVADNMVKVVSVEEDDGLRWAWWYVPSSWASRYWTGQNGQGHGDAAFGDYVFTMEKQLQQGHRWLAAQLV